VSSYFYIVSLRLRHPSADLLSLASPIGVSPIRTWKAGEPRTTPKGTPLTGVNRDSYWYGRMIEDTSSQTQSLGDALAGIVDTLTPHRQFFEAFAADRGRAEFFIGWYFPEGNSGDVLGHELLRRLSELKIDLSFDIYP
jgi:hypothetical protein